MCDTGAAIIHEARSLDPPQDETHCAASFQVLATPSVFRHFVQFNPSMLAAIKYRAACRQVQHAAPQPAETAPLRPPAAMGATRFAEMHRRTNGMTQHRSHYPPNQINRMGGELPESE